MSCFDGVKKNFGFGYMRLPMKDDEVDIEQVCRMTDAFLEAGFNYFDTAHGYIDGKSEIAMRECLVKRHPRESYLLANKLSDPYFSSQEEIRPFFQSQLEVCGVDYFDFYLMHAQDKKSFEKYKRCRAYETAMELKAEGKIKHLCISFHDTADVLDEILTEYPQVEAVQIQFNYLDYDDPEVQSRLCYEVCRKHGKPIIVMEPVRGGRLVNLPDEAADLLKNLGGGSPASYAIRFTAGFEGVLMVLSGMSNMEQLEDNISYMADFKPLDEKERAAVEKVAAALRSMKLVSCTACRYCTEGCPKNIPIPDIFAYMNAEKSGEKAELKSDGAGASDCIGCGKCEKACPQHLPIRALLRDFES